MELYLEAVGLKKSFALRTVIECARLELRDGDRVGLVGENGAGKTTLLRLLSGEMEPDEGYVRALRPLSFIRQLDDGDEAPIGDAALASAFAAKDARESLSGGERTRRRVASALAAKNCVLLADEPTSDLDREGVTQLERHLRAFEGALLLVSHDRALLDALTTRIWELEDGKITEFSGNYSAYRAEKERRRARQRFEYDHYREEQARLRGAIQGEKEHASQVTKLPSRMGNSEARLHRRSATEVEEHLHRRRKALETRLNQMKRVDRPTEDPDIRMRLGACDDVTSRTALEARGLSIRFGARSLLDNASMRVPTRSHTALLGPNGCGKTTLLERLRAGGAGVRVSPGVKIGWFGQDHAKDLRLDDSALENVMETSIHDPSSARTVLARLGLRGDEALKACEKLSGGERAKVSLARLFLSSVNCLLLDEPTNHLDVYSMEALAGVLRAYEGTVLLVSHDRAFVEEVCDRVVTFEGTRLTTFEGKPSERERALTQKPDDRALQRTTLEMRMAILAARMSAPKKGDSPEALNEEYLRLAAELRSL